MYRNFAAWFTIWSIVIATKSKIWISTTGRRPAIAAPTPAPRKVASEIGVSRTRSSPNFSRRPRVTPKIPPMSPTSSPMTKTRASRCISPCKASLSASAIVSSRPPVGAGSRTSTWGA